MPAEVLSASPCNHLWHPVATIVKLCMGITSRLTIVSREAKAVRNERVSYLHVAPL